MEEEVRRADLEAGARTRLITKLRLLPVSRLLHRRPSTTRWAEALGEARTTKRVDKRSLKLSLRISRPSKLKVFSLALCSCSVELKSNLYLQRWMHR